jgi:hypothetical protein
VVFLDVFGYAVRAKAARLNAAKQNLPGKEPVVPAAERGRAVGSREEEIRQRISELKKMSKPTQDRTEIAQVGTISANGDEAIGKLIAEATRIVRKSGVIAFTDWVEGAGLADALVLNHLVEVFDGPALQLLLVVEPLPELLRGELVLLLQPLLPVLLDLLRALPSRAPGYAGSAPSRCSPWHPRRVKPGPACLKSSDRTTSGLPGLKV